MSTPPQPTSSLQEKSAPQAAQTHARTASNGSMPSSPYSFMSRFLSQGSSPSFGSASSSSSSTPPSAPSTPASGPQRAASEPAVIGFSPQQTLAYPHMQRARSLDTDPLKLPPQVAAAQRGATTSAANSPAFAQRTFSVQGGFPAAETQRKHENSFLELLCKQDSFIGND